jgi:hypothetical protein
MTTKPLTPESAAALIALTGVTADPARSASIAEVLNTQVAGANKAFAALAFETEPATYLKIAAEEAP